MKSSGDIIATEKRSAATRVRVVAIAALGRTLMVARLQYAWCSTHE